MSDTRRNYLEHTRQTLLAPIGPFQIQRRSRAYADGPGIYRELSYIVTAPDRTERIFPDWEAARDWAKANTPEE